MLAVLPLSFVKHQRMAEINPDIPRIPKWPFFASDAALVFAAVYIVRQASRPMPALELGLVVLCMGLACLLGVLPFIQEYQACVRLAEGARLRGAVATLTNVEALSERVSTATRQWSNIHSEAEKAAAAAKSVADGMSAELKQFTEFMTRANDSEKANLRLEVEKLHRAEGEWLQVLVRMLDHTFALQQAAVRSGQAKVIDQISRFQHSCCDAARRVGLAPFIAASDEPYDAAKHQWADGNGKHPEKGVVADTVAAGFTYQGRMVRPALVKLRSEEESAIPESKEPQLPLGA